MLLAWPQVGSDKRTLRPDLFGVSQLLRVMFDVCCCLSGVLSPTVGCVSVAVGVATSRVGPTAIEDRCAWFSQFWRVMFDMCCCLSGALSPTVGCVSVAVGVATSRVGQTETEARYVWSFEMLVCYV